MERREPPKRALFARSEAQERSVTERSGAKPHKRALCARSEA